MGREDEIKLIAYRIWEEEGCLDGNDCEHWLRAEAIWEEQQKSRVVTKSTTKKQTEKPGAKVATGKRKAKRS